MHRHGHNCHFGHSSTFLTTIINSDFQLSLDMHCMGYKQAIATDLLTREEKKKKATMKSQLQASKMVFRKEEEKMHSWNINSRRFIAAIFPPMQLNKVIVQCQWKYDYMMEESCRVIVNLLRKFAYFMTTINVICCTDMQTRNYFFRS